jgi:hypothetical protein
VLGNTVRAWPPRTLLDALRKLPEPFNTTLQDPPEARTSSDEGSQVDQRSSVQEHGFYSRQSSSGASPRRFRRLQSLRRKINAATEGSSAAATEGKTVVQAQPTSAEELLLRYASKHGLLLERWVQPQRQGSEQHSTCVLLVAPGEEGVGASVLVRATAEVSCSVVEGCSKLFLHPSMSCSC